MKYPDISDDDFYKKINKIYEDYKIPKKQKTFEEFCFPKGFKLQPQQKLISKIINPKTPYKGILLQHNIGSGKTCTAIQIGEAWKHERRIIVVTPASLKGNFRGELRSMCADNEYLTIKERELLKELKPSSQEYKDIIKKSDERIDEYYEIYSNNKFIQLAQDGDINLRNSILIIDEIQNLVSEEGTYYYTLKKLIDNAPDSLRVVLMSATPMFDKPHEIGLTLNLLRPETELPIGREFDRKFIDFVKKKNGEYEYKPKNLELFKEMIKGYVSYFRGAPPYVYPEMKVKYVKCEMSNFQFDAYLSVLKNEEREYNLKRMKKEVYKSMLVKNLPNSFFIGTRFVSNIVFPNKKVNEEGFKSFRKNRITKELHKYSTKFDKIISKIEGSAGKMFVYSNFKEFAGLKSFARVLEEFGYKDYAKHGEGKKRFAIWSGDENLRYKEEIKAVYNNKNNLRGEKLKVILGSASIKEGVSFTAVRQVHVLEPYWNLSRMAQIFGRASRFCSHKDVDEDKRLVKIYVYLSVKERYDEETIDEYIYKLSKRKNQLVQSFEKAIKESAIDCKLFYNANVFEDEGEEPITCES